MVALPTPVTVAEVLLDNAALALAYHQRGVRVFPCQPDRFGPSPEHPKGDPEAKRPYVKWQGPEPGQRAAIEAWWRTWPDALVGVGLGDANLVVIDVDGGEAGVAAWEAYAAERGGLPDETPVVITPTDGRHYFFRLPDGVKHGNSRGGLPKKAELPVDVRGTESGYVIACGTERPFHGFYLPDNGDTFAWLRAPLIPDWLLAVLKGQREREEASQAPATTLPAIILPPDIHEHPQVRAWFEGAFNDEIAGVSSCPSGGRNEQLNRAAFSLGTLVGGGWLNEGTVVSALEQACRDCGLWKDDGPPQCRKTINSGLSKGKLDPRPLPANIAETLELERMAAELQRTLIVNEDGSRTDMATGEVFDPPAPLDLIGGRDFPDHLTRVPGLVGRIVDWIEGSARRPSRAMALGAAVGIVGTAMGRYFAGPTKAGTHLYTLTLAKTGAGKDHPIQQIRRSLNAAGMKECLGAEEFQSSPSVINMALNKPLCICTMDEFGAFLARINSRRAGGFEMGITKSLRSLWGTNYGIFLTPEWAARPSEPIYAPHIGIYAASTHEEFFAALDSKQAVNGFLNRFLLVSSERKAPEVDEPELPADVVPEDIIEGLQARFGGGNRDFANTACIKSSVDILPRVIPWADDGAQAIYKALVREIERIGDRNPDAVPYLARTAEMAVRLATIRAGGINVFKPAVTAADMQWGRDVAMHSAESMAIMAGKYVADTDAQADAKRIIRILEEAGGRMKKRDLLRRLQHRLRERDLKDVLAALMASETVRIDKERTAATGPLYDVVVLATDLD